MADISKVLNTAMDNISKIYSKDKVDISKIMGVSLPSAGGGTNPPCGDITSLKFSTGWPDESWGSYDITKIEMYDTTNGWVDRTTNWSSTSQNFSWVSGGEGGTAQWEFRPTAESDIAVLTPFGTWQENYRPTKLRITFTEYNSSGVDKISVELVVDSDKTADGDVFKSSYNGTEPYQSFYESVISLSDICGSSQSAGILLVNSYSDPEILLERPTAQSLTEINIADKLDTDKTIRKLWINDFIPHATGYNCLYISNIEFYVSTGEGGSWESKTSSFSSGSNAYADSGNWYIGRYDYGTDSMDQRFGYLLTSGSTWTNYAPTRMRVTYSYGAHPRHSISNTAPDAPSNIRAEEVAQNTLIVRWDDNSDNETGFKIEREQVGGEGGGYSQIDTVGTDITRYDDSGLSAATTYNYRVRAYNSIGNSSYTDPVLNVTTGGTGYQWWPLDGVHYGAGQTSTNQSWSYTNNQWTTFTLYGGGSGGRTVSLVCTGGWNTSNNPSHMKVTVSFGSSVSNLSIYHKDGGGSTVGSTNTSGSVFSINLTTPLTGSTWLTELFFYFESPVAVRIWVTDIQIYSQTEPSGGI